MLCSQPRNPTLSLTLVLLAASSCPLHICESSWINIVSEYLSTACQVFHMSWKSLVLPLCRGHTQGSVYRILANSKECALLHFRKPGGLSFWPWHCTVIEPLRVRDYTRCCLPKLSSTTVSAAQCSSQYSQGFEYKGQASTCTSAYIVVVRFWQ